LCTQIANEAADLSAQEGFVFGTVQHDVGATRLLRKRHLAFDTLECLSPREAVAPLQPGDLGFTVCCDHDNFIHARVDAGFEQERDFVNNDGIGSASGNAPRTALLFAFDPWMNDSLKAPELSPVAKDNGAESRTINRPIGQQDSFAKAFHDFAPGRFAGLDHVTGQLIGIDNGGTKVSEEVGDGAFSRCDSSRQSHEDHAAKNTM
jgi:hypothetical protein